MVGDVGGGRVAFSNPGHDIRLLRELSVFDNIQSVSRKKTETVLAIREQPGIA